MEKIKETNMILGMELQRYERENKQLSQFYQEMEMKTNKKGKKKTEKGQLYLLN